MDMSAGNLGDQGFKPIFVKLQARAHHVHHCAAMQDCDQSMLSVCSCMLLAVIRTALADTGRAVHTNA